MTHWSIATFAVGLAILMPGLSYFHVPWTGYYGAAATAVTGLALMGVGASGVLDGVGHDGSYQGMFGAELYCDVADPLSQCFLEESLA